MLGNNVIKGFAIITLAAVAIVIYLENKDAFLLNVTFGFLFGYLVGIK